MRRSTADTMQPAVVCRNVCTYCAALLRRNDLLPAFLFGMGDEPPVWYRILPVDQYSNIGKRAGGQHRCAAHTAPAQMHAFDCIVCKPSSVLAASPQAFTASVWLLGCPCARLRCMQGTSAALQSRCVGPLRSLLCTSQ